MQQLNPRRATVPQGRFTADSQQPRKLMLALALLLIALVVILVKDRQFWFGADQATIESDMPESQPAPKAATPTASPAPAHPAAKKQIPTAKSPVAETKPAEGASITRTVLPPLDVEVVAGNTRRALHPKSNTKVEASVAAEMAAPTNAAQREALAAPAIQPEAAVTATYPPLAQHMNVQGSVVLQAIISTAGVIEDLRVMSGPAILASAAQQAVREWRFKPVLQNGQAVETKARITVNFSIKVADNSISTTLADSRMSDALIITR